MSKLSMNEKIAEVAHTALRVYTRTGGRVRLTPTALASFCHVRLTVREISAVLRLHHADMAKVIGREIEYSPARSRRTYSGKRVPEYPACIHVGAPLAPEASP